MKTNLFGKSTRYLNWVTKLDERTCVPCKDLNGKIYVRGEKIDPKPPLHLHDRCRIKAMKCVEAGEATDLELDGADLDYYGGKRGTKRLLYSNDGLLFVSYDHYHTFVEVVDNDAQWRFA